jgi:ankyrin repeat protein
MKNLTDGQRAEYPADSSGKTLADSLRAALERDIDVNALLDFGGQRALHCVANKSEGEASELLQLLLDRPDIDVDIQNYIDMTALHHATLFGQMWCVRQLLSAGVDTKVLVANIYGYLPPVDITSRNLLTSI